jgi:2,3-bisphosphoglycerate-independent phosphoglycerate mutase
MKYAIVIPDGAADLPIDELGGKTPLEAAEKPGMDWVAANGKCGTVRTVPKGLPPGSDVAMLSVAGYDPRECYTGRAPLEAAAQGIHVADDEVIFRCNLVTVVDGTMQDNTAGHISTEEAAAILYRLNEDAGGDDVRFYPGVGYRHLMTLRGEGEAETVPPHDILGKPVAGHLPRGKGSEVLRGLMDKARLVLADSEINDIRRDLGENPATDIWLWGQGKMPRLRSFGERYSVSGAAITAVDLVRGLAKLIGWDVIEVEGATGYLDTNYEGKGAAAVAALENHDLVFVHVEATDEASHSGDPKAKVEAIERIDRAIVRPLLDRLRAEGDEWRMLVLPDHPTPCSLRTHTGEPVPFALAGKAVESVVHEPFCEATAARSDLHVDPGCELMEFLLSVR